MMGTVVPALKLGIAFAIIISFVWVSFRMVSSPESVRGAVAWILANKFSVRRLLAMIQLIAGLGLCALGYLGGRDHLFLVLSGAHAEGRVIGYRQEQLPNSGSAAWNYISLPKVEFVTGRKAIQFEDHVGYGSEVLNLRVPILYDPKTPSRAMIDHSLMNWVPWAPMIAVGLLLLLSFARHEIRRGNVREAGRN